MTAPSSIAHYRITAKIGAGGMGEVYRATDTKLGRDVALKVLPPEMARDAERLARFQREARAVAALNHPHIVTIFSVEECDGVHFLTMELLEGQSLDRRIPCGGLPVDQIVEIASALAEALAAAHEKGIVHRDLKPANVMVTDEGRAKVLDFGLAKDVRVGAPSDATMTSAGQTQAGIVMGTPAYMSPEQISGRTLDHRSDIFSLGVVLHEMATGKRPFPEHSSAELISAILRDSPPLVTDARPDVPSDLARVIRRCMEKDPRHRIQTARDVSNEFRDLARQSSRTTSISSPTSHATATPDSGAGRADQGFWIAVLPFKTTGASPEVKALGEGLSEEIVAGFSRFSYLRVITYGSTQRYADQSSDLRAVGKELGARYVMTGNLRQVAARLRVAVQLVDATTGAQLWSETYERPFNAEAIFELQDDLVPRIVSTAADMHGVLPRSMSAAVRLKAADQMSPYEALLRSFGYNERFTPEDLAEVRNCLERAVQQSPTNGDCWAMLSLVYANEYGHWDNAGPDSIEQALRAARTAVEAAPLSSLPYYALAQALFFKREIQAFRVAAERAVSQNPMDGATAAFMGLLIAYAGDWERGCDLSEKGLQLNPNHPGWYRYTAWHDAYRKKDYRKALGVALQLNAPKSYYTHAVLAICYAQLGQMQEARKALGDMLALKPNYAQVARELHSRWIEPDLVEELMDGLRKAGLEIPSAVGAVTTEVATSSSAVKADSGAARADEGFWIAVLPFKFKGAAAGLDALADGITEEIITGLSRFSYLRVVSRGSTAKYLSETDARAIDKELGAQYVMEGSLRQVGSTLRIAVQLVDTTTGAHLWAETFERIYKAEAAFELMDEVVPRIVSTVADAHGVLPHNMSEAIRDRDPTQLSPYEAVLRSFAHWQRVNAEEHAASRIGLELAVKQAPNRAECWAMLSLIYREEYAHGFNLLPDPVGRAYAAARRAVEAAPSNNLCYHALSSALFYRREFEASRIAAERAIALNPMDSFTIAYLGFQVAYAGNWERGCALAEQARKLNPHHPGWYWFPSLFEAYRDRDYQAALDIGLRINMPGLWRTNFALAAVYGQLGERGAASSAVSELLAIRPNFNQIARQELAKFWDAQLVEHLIEGLRKAGMEISAG